MWQNDLVLLLVALTFVLLWVFSYHVGSPHTLQKPHGETTWKGHMESKRTCGHMVESQKVLAVPQNPVFLPSILRHQTCEPATGDYGAQTLQPQMTATAADVT